MRFTAVLRSICLVNSVGLALFGSCLLVATEVGAAQTDQVHSADDGWRRTTLGWERTPIWGGPVHGALHSQFIFGEEVRDKAGRWDFHPALLVAIEIMVVAGGFLLWPTGQGYDTQPNGDQGALRTSSRARRAA
jgi:hypothetical protein